MVTAGTRLGPLEPEREEGSPLETPRESAAPPPQVQRSGLQPVREEARCVVICQDTPGCEEGCLVAAGSAGLLCCSSHHLPAW